ncbi:TPA: cadherin-like domain-containing protein [Legionella pneumophila]
MQRQLVAEIHPADFAHHFHTDHPVFSCSKIEQKQLNTWVSFQSAEQPLLGQFSVSGNSARTLRDMLHPASKLAAMLRPRSHRFALESRQLFDGAALVEAAHATDAPDAAHAAPAHAEAPHPAAAETHPAAKAVADAPAAAAASEAPAAAATPHAVYVMDQSVVDWQQVVQALPTGSEVILIDNRSDGVAQLAAALHGRTDISALQIVSHGASGQITLGDSVITADNIAEHAAQWAAIGASLTADGDILLYGCDVAGQSDALLVRMSALTGADVAASADATGAAVKGGNWTLERSVGQVEAQVLNDVDYQGLLAAPTVTSAATKLSVFENSTLNAPGADQATLSGWNITNGGVGNVTVVVQVDGDANGAPDLVVGGLTVGNAGAPAGTLSFTGTAAQATAWVNSLVFKATDVELGNTAARAVIQVRVTDAATSLVATRTLAVTVTPSNDPVTLSSTPQAVGEGADTPLTVATLRALDPEVDVALTQQPSQIVYGVTANPQYGYLTLNGVRLGIGSVFTQQDVIDGDVHYVHTATGATQNQPDSFGVRANDGATPVAASAAATIALTIAPVNQAPTVSGLGVVLEGQPGNAVDGTGAPLSQVGNFIVADGGGDDASSALTVRITGLPTDGTLYFTGTALVNGTSVNYTVPHAITAAELATGSGFVIAYEARAGLTYGNNGTRDNTGAGTYPFVDGFKVIVSDAGGGTGTPGSTVETNIAITVRPVNDDPTYTGALAPEATVTATGNSTGSYTGPYAVTLTPAMLNATDVDSVDGRLTFAVTSQSGLNQGTLLLNGKLLPVGGVFTVDDVINGRVQYVQTQGAAAGDTDTFQFQVIDNTIGVRWNADGTSITRVGGVYDNLGDPNRVSDDRLHTFDFTVRLAPTAAGNATGFLPNVNTAVESSSTHAGTDTAGSTRGVLDEDGSVVIAGAPSGTDPYLSYVVDGVPPSQVVYTILGLTDGGADWNGAIQRQVSGGWVDLNVYDTFTQADLNAGNIRYKHDGTSEDFQSTVRLSASAGVLVDSNGTLMPDNWDTTFTFYVTPTNDAPAVVGSSNAVVAENGTIGITSGMLQISDPDDATSETRLEGTAQNGTGSPALPNGGGDNFAYNNDATGANALRFRVTSLPPGGTLEYLSGGTWVTLTAGTLIDASLLTNSAGSTGLRFVSDGSEVRSTSFNVEAVDRWNQSSNTATVRIQITNVNDAPQIAATPNLPDPAGSVNNPLTGVTEGSAAQITPGMLSAFDPDSSKLQVQYTVTRAPAHGSVALSTDGGTTFKLLGVGSSFTQADVEAGLVYYVNNGDEGDGKTPGSDPPSDSFGFSLGDGNKEQPGNQFWIHTVPANDVATVTAPASADVLGSGTTPVPITGIVVADTDIDVLVQGEEDFLRVEVSVVDPSNNVVGDARINFTAAAPTSARSLVSGAGSNTLVLQGTRAEVNAALASLTLAFNADKDSTDLRLRTTVDDRLYTAGGVLATGANGGASATTNDDGTLINATNNRASAFTALTVSNVNDVPTLGGATVITVTEDTPLALSNLGFVIADADSFGRDVTVTVQLYSDSNRTALANSATEGAFLLGTTAGLTSATGNNSNTITLTGSIAEVQAALDAIRIASATDFNNGPLYMRTTVSDFAHADGGKQAVTDTTVNLLAVNDAPTLTVPTDKVLAAGTSIALPGFVIGDARDLSQGAVDYVEVTVGATLPGGGPAGTLTVVDSGLATTDNNGSATIVVKGTFADVQATLNSMVFAPTAGNADARVQISTLVDDKSNGAETNPNGTGNNTTAGTFFVNVSNTNDGPVLTAPTAVTVNEDSANNLVPGLSLADPDDFGAVERVTLDLGPGAKGTLTLGTITGLVFSTGDGTADGTMVFQGTKAAINAALATLSFTPTLNTNTVSTTQSLTITVDDLGNTGAGGPLTDTKTVAITITPVNDAPVRNGAGTAVLPAATEDVTGNPSATVASLFTGAFNDLLDTVSGGTTANAFAGIAITANASIPTQGVWQYSTDGTNWTDLPIVSTTSAFLLNPNDSLRFVPAANYFGTPGQLTARLIDGSGAAFTTGTRDNVSNDTTLSGGITRYSNSANAVTLATTVANVNDRPTLSATTLLTITEDTPNATTIGQIAQPSYGDALDNQSSIAGGGNATGTLGWVAITGNTTDASKGQWQYFEAGAWQTVPAAGLGDANAIVLASNTPLRFVATADYNGPVPGGLTIRVADASNATDTGVNLGTGQNLTASLNDGANSTSHWSMAGALNVLVTAVSDAANDTATTHAGVPVTTAVLTNDSFENPGAAVTAVTNGAHGSVVINGNGTVTYTPVAGYVGTDSYTYTVTSGGVTETATVNVTITNVAPVPQPDTNSVPEDTPATGNVLGNETDAETDPLQVTQFVVNGQTAAAGGSVTIAGVGTLTIAANGAYVFTPVADWHGTVPQVTYTATDGNSNGTVTSTLDIVVTPVVDIANDTIATHAGTPVVVPVLGNDGFENPGAAVTVVTAGAHGTVVINANGTVTYTPVAGYVGPDSFTYTVTSGGVTETATVIVDVTNVPPVARPDTGSVDEDGPPLVRNAATGVLASAGVPGSVDSDPDGDPIAVIGVSAGTATSVGGIPTTTVGQSVTGVYGTLVLQADGSYQYDVQNANPTVNALKTGFEVQWYENVR